MEEYYNGDSFGDVKQRFKDRSKKTKEKTKQLLSKQAVKIAQRAEEHEPFINKGPLAWALTVWRCSLVFSSVDKTVSVCIHLLPGLVFFTIRWWDPVFFGAMHPEGTPDRASWPDVENQSYLWKWLFFLPLAAYFLWQVLYYLIVEVLRRQRLLRDPEVVTSYRELSKKAKKVNNMCLCLSGLLGDQNRLVMFILLQAIFTVATTELTVPIFLSYKLHVVYHILKVSASVRNGGNFVLEVMPRQVILKEKKKSEMRDVTEQQHETPLQESSMETSSAYETPQ